MRGAMMALATGMLALGLASGAAAQSVSSSGTSSERAQPQNDPLQAAQPMSLGDPARLGLNPSAFPAGTNQTPTIVALIPRHASMVRSFVFGSLRSCDLNNARRNY